jgi:hypothetical protein
MLKLKTDWNKINRMEEAASSWVLDHAVTGTWVAPSASGVDQPTLGGFALPILTESNRDGSVGFTGDVSVTGNVTVAYGSFAGITDRFAGTPAVGDVLYVTADGKLANAADAGIDLSTAHPVSAAICTKASYSTTYMGKSYDVIEFVTK